ncbi:MAG: hypothetical protein U1F35_07185 [Steroidobacteraceae bacterium]
MSEVPARRNRRWLVLAAVLLLAAWGVLARIQGAMRWRARHRPPRR